MVNIPNEEVNNRHQEHQRQEHWYPTPREYFNHLVEQQLIFAQPMLHFANLNNRLVIYITVDNCNKFLMDSERHLKSMK